MATSAKHFPFLFLFLLYALLSSLHSHARESYFFNKAATTTTTTNNNTNNAKETVEVLPSKTKEQDPKFIPDTQSGYGLYGHHSGHLPTTTTTNSPPYTTTNRPYKTESGGSYTTDNNYNNYNKEAYVTDPQGMSDTRFMDSGYTTPNAATKTINGGPYYPTTGINNNINDNNYDNYKEAYVTDPQGTRDTRFMDRGYTTATAAAAYTNNNDNYYNGGNYNGNIQQQGMSDTRFLENGRYYYDINNEEKYRNGYGNSRGVNYKNRRYFGSYNNYENSYEDNNSMEGYQNEEDQFEESEEESIYGLICVFLVFMLWKGEA